MDKNVEQQNVQPTPEAAPEKPVQSQVAPIQSNVIVQSQMPAQPVQPVEPVEEVPVEVPKKSNLGLIIALIVALLVVVGVVVGIVIYKNNSDDSSSGKKTKTEEKQEEKEEEEEEKSEDLLNLDNTVKYYQTKYNAKCQNYYFFECTIGNDSITLWDENKVIERVSVSSDSKDNVIKYLSRYVVTDSQKKKAESFYDIMDYYSSLRFASNDLVLSSDDSYYSSHKYDVELSIDSTTYQGDFIEIVDKDTVDVSAFYEGVNETYRVKVVKKDPETKLDYLDLYSFETKGYFNYDDGDSKSAYKLRVEAEIKSIDNDDFVVRSKYSSFNKEVKIMSFELIDHNNQKVLLEADKYKFESSSGTNYINRYEMRIPSNNGNYTEGYDGVGFSVEIEFEYKDASTRDSNYETDYEYAMSFFKEVKRV